MTVPNDKLITDIIKYVSGEKAADIPLRGRIRRIVDRIVALQPHFIEEVRSRPFSVNTTVVHAMLLHLQQTDLEAGKILMALAAQYTEAGLAEPAESVRSGYGKPSITNQTTMSDQRSIEVGRETPLTVRFGHEQDTTSITWFSDIIGVRSSRCVLPFKGDDLLAVVHALDFLQHPTVGLSPEEVVRLRALGLPLTEGLPDPALHRAVGQALFESLCADPDASQALSTVRDYARYENASLALRLHFPPDAIELAAYPWELLWDADPTPLLFSRGQLASCTRHLDLAEALPTHRRSHGPVRLLSITPHTGSDSETRIKIQQSLTLAWAPMLASGEVVIDELSPVTRRALLSYVQNHPPPDIVHFTGHGRYHNGQGWLVFDTDSGEWDRIPASQLIPLFSTTRLLMLCACQSSVSGKTGLLTGVAPALSAAGVPAVVAMQLTVRTTAAIRFAETLYSALSCGKSLQQAVMQARQVLYVEETDAASWYVPTVTIRTQETGSFTLFD